jgi:hypothetical protein
LEHAAERAFMMISGGDHAVNPSYVLRLSLQLVKAFQACVNGHFHLQSLSGVEILLNCVWLVLGLSLISAWSMLAWHTRSGESEGMLPSRRLQFTAILLLVILLFPVISLTDDIARCTAPRDAERALRLHDLLDGTQPTAALLPSAMAWMDALSVVLRNGPSRPVEQDAKLTALLQGTRLPTDSRPPPASL